MHLRRLSIHALPGIEPGFTFEPPDAGINIVTGPNAIGKSSLARALQYLLASHRADPPALSLEAEFKSDDARWQVSRNGNQIVWRRNGEVVSRPPLPGADRLGLFRLSVENLLDDSDANDKALAERLRRELHGNFDLGQPRIEIGRRFAVHEARILAEAGKARRRVESDYADLQRRESELPALERRIDTAVAASVRREHLDQALRLADAIDVRKDRESALHRFPPDMDRLRGDELEQLEENEKRVLRLNEELRDRQRDLEAAEAALERTGLAQAAPAPEEVRAAEERLRQLDRKSVERESARTAVADTGATLRDVLAHFNPGREPPRLDADAFRRTEEVAGPLIAAQQRRRELLEQLALAGEAPRAADVDRLRDGAEALRAWLAGDAAGSGRVPASTQLGRIVSWLAAAAVAFVAIAAFIQGAPVAFAGAVAALIAFGLALFLLRGPRTTAPSPTDAAMRRFGETGLGPPSPWDERGVREHLRDVVEVRLNQLTLQQERAAVSERIRLQIEDTDADIERLEEARTALAGEIGFDPRLPVAEFQRFVHLCSDWDKARSEHVRQRARFDLLDREIADTASLVREFLRPWRATDAPGLEDPTGTPDMVLLRGAFDDLRARIDAARDVQDDIRAIRTNIQSLRQRIDEVDSAVDSLFAHAGVALRDRAVLAHRIEQLPQWKEASDALHQANTGEAVVRARLAEQPAFVALADEGERVRLHADLQTATVEAGEHTRLIQLQAEIRTRLNDAGADGKLEQAAAEESRARQVLEDKRDEALLAVATKTLLDDVERAFEAEHEPVVLRRARDVFADVTARAFDLRLRGDGSFVAHDVRQEAARELAELSSGTRMQLLLALRLAWIETQEQGGEALPLFLDEALTTSDEERFAVMAQSLERLAGAGDEGRDGAGNMAGARDDGRGRPGNAAGNMDDDGTGTWSEDGTRAGAGAADGTGRVVAAEHRAEGGAGVRADDRIEVGIGAGRGRQIFYLSARRHEAALWRQATGTSPAVIDLAAVRFPAQASAPEDYRVEAPPTLPAPNGRSAEAYASLLGVPPRLDPHRPEGGIHLFHLLRDDLALLHSLMETWRIASLGQLEVLLASDAACAALPGEELQRRLRRRCRVVRTWVELWRQGRGRPVDRGVLEQCSAISVTFIDRVAELAAQVRGDAEALVRALRAGEVDRFRSRKLHELEQWLAEEGYVDDQDRLTGDDRRRLTLQRAVPATEVDAGDVNRVVTWLEASDAIRNGADDQRGASDDSIGGERIRI